MQHCSDLLPERKHAPRSLGRVLVLGLGKSGRAVSSYCAELVGDRIESLYIAGGESTDENKAFADTLAREGVTVEFDTYGFESAYDLCIASPGIPQVSDFYQAATAASTELISEVEFAWRESDVHSNWIAITGTNGKTTTTALVAHLLRSAGLQAAAVGNIGETCIEAVAAGGTTHYVAEVSSYQLASTKDFAPEVAVLLNITPDHLSWHGDHQHYVEAKLKVFANLKDTADSCAILDATDEEVRRYVKVLKAQSFEERGFAYIPLGAQGGLDHDMRSVCGSDNAAFVEEGALCVAQGGAVQKVGSIDTLQIRGEHNVANALAAATAALVSGVDAASIAEALAGFKALEHRIEPCGEVEGVACFNDSKATNVDATLKALTAFGEVKPIVLLGGYDKNTELDVLVDAAGKQCKAVVCYGAAGPRFSEAFSSSALPSALEGTLEQAFDKALTFAQKGDVVVLSPACASFDEFTSFEHRGNEFKEYVRRRSAERGS